MLTNTEVIGTSHWFNNLGIVSSGIIISSLLRLFYAYQLPKHDFSLALISIFDNFIKKSTIPSRTRISTIMAVGEPPQDGDGTPALVEKGFATLTQLQ